MAPPIWALMALTALMWWGIIGAAGSGVCGPCDSCLGEAVHCAARNAEDVEALAELGDWAADLTLSPAAGPPSLLRLRRPLPRVRNLTAEDADYDSTPPLDSFPGLERLRLLRCSIRSVDWEGLAPAPALDELDLTGGRLVDLGLPNLPRLRTLRLTSNRLAELNAPTLDGLPALEELRLDRNRLRRIPRRLFRRQRRLRELDLSANRIAEVEEFAFLNLTSLTALRLRRNEIENLKDGTFHALKSLRSLRLDRNRLTSVSRRWTFGLESLVELTLSKNAIETLEVGCWEWSGRLRSLDLSGNRLRHLDARTFEHLSELRSLDLSSNGISSLAESAFSHAPNLEVLRLDRNSLSRSVEDAEAPFSALRALLRLSLASNGVRSICERAFVGLDSLASLDLADNAITSLHEGAFAPLSSLRELTLDSSALLCDCGLRWLPDRLSSTGVEGFEAACGYPEALRGRRAASLPAEAFECEGDSPKPTIVAHPLSGFAIEGAELALECEAISSGASEMRFRWRRDDDDLPTTAAAERAGVHPEGRVSSLRIPAAGASDSGSYQCAASNEYGAAYSERAEVSVVELPSFDRRPSDVTAEAGGTATLECSARGRPEPQISWKKDDGNDFPAASERRMLIELERSAYFIVKAKAADAGVYACNASNPAGWITANATLTVLEPPTFVNGMENKEVVAGESVVIECMASGSPKPKLRWLKDGEPMAIAERHFFTAEDQLLVIVGAVPADEGIYACEIANSLGAVRDSTELRVLPPATDAPSADDDMMGIIIITVVCCAVGTSVVWVVIIYQTRKRLKKSALEFDPDAIRAVVPPASLGGAYVDDVSERSSCKDSGTGDSAKRSSIVEEAGTPSELDAVVSVYVNPTHAALEENRALLSSDGIYRDDRVRRAQVQMHRLDDIVPERDPNKTYPYS